MHPYRRLVQELMDARGMSAAELARKSGVSKAVISRILTDERDSFTRPPEPGTIAGFARAFGGNADTRLSLAVAESMGLPVGEVPVSDASLLSNDELLRELSDRLRSSGGAAGHLTVVPPDFPDPEDYDVKAAGRSPQDAGEPQPEQP